MFPTISTFIHDGDAPTAALEWAIEAAGRWGSHLNIIGAGVDVTDPGFYYAGAHAFAVDQNLALAGEAAAKLESSLKERLRVEIIPYEVETVTLMSANMAGFLAERARLSDLIVMPSPYYETRSQLDVTALESCLFEARVPVIVIPQGCKVPPQPEKILLAWNDAPEALFATKCALPLLAQANSTLVAIIDPPKHAANRSDPGGRLAQFLSRHGVHPEVAILSRTETSVANQLIKSATETGCDMIVMGAYGHSRLRESILGGATRDMLETAKIPVFMSH